MLRKLLNKKLLKNIKCKINKNLTLKKSQKSRSKKSKKFYILSTYNIKNGKYKVWRFIFIKKKSKSSDRLHEIFKKQSKNKERIDPIKEDLEDLSYKLSKSELKEIKRNLYNIEKRKKLALKKLINI